MTELKKHAFLLFIITLLLFAKFIVVPIFDWQNKEVEKIKLLEKRQSKITQVLAGYDENVQQQSRLMVELERAEHLFFAEQAEASFKLTQQKMIEKLLTKHKLKAINIGWQTSTVLPELSASRYPLKISISGQHIDLIEFISDIESKEQLIEIAEFNISFKGQSNENLGRVTGGLTLYLFADDSTESYTLAGG